MHTFFCLAAFVVTAAIFFSAVFVSAAGTIEPYDQSGRVLLNSQYTRLCVRRGAEKPTRIPYHSENYPNRRTGSPGTRFKYKTYDDYYYECDPAENVVRLYQCGNEAGIDDCTQDVVLRETIPGDNTTRYSHEISDANVTFDGRFYSLAEFLRAPPSSRYKSLAAASSTCLVPFSWSGASNQRYVCEDKIPSIVYYRGDNEVPCRTEYARVNYEKNYGYKCETVEGTDIMAVVLNRTWHGSAGRVDWMMVNLFVSCLVVLLMVLY